MGDVGHYLEHGKVPDYNLVPDSHFPVCYGEKGILRAELISPPLSPEVLDFCGGTAGNMVADRASLTLRSSPQLLEKLAGAEGVSEDGDAVTITATGRSAHAARPEGSLNAIGVLAGMAAEKNLVSGAAKKIFAFVAEVCGEHSGEALGIQARHEEFGELTCVAGVVRVRDGRVMLHIDIRYPYNEKADVLAMVIKSRCIERGFTVEDVDDNPASYVERSGAFVSALADAYAKVTGDGAEPYIMGGGTYARKLPNAVAFGPSLPGGKKPQGLPGGHGGEHEPDEALCLGEFITALEVYASAIAKIDEIE